METFFEPGAAQLEFHVALGAHEQDSLASHRGQPLTREAAAAEVVRTYRAVGTVSLHRAPYDKGHGSFAQLAQIRLARPLTQEDDPVCAPGGDQVLVAAGLIHSRRAQQDFLLPNGKGLRHVREQFEMKRIGNPAAFERREVEGDRDGICAARELARVAIDTEAVRPRQSLHCKRRFAGYQRTVRHRARHRRLCKAGQLGKIIKVADSPTARRFSLALPGQCHSPFAWNKNATGCNVMQRISCRRPAAASHLPG